MVVIALVIAQEQMVISELKVAAEAAQPMESQVVVQVAVAVMVSAISTFKEKLWP